MVKIDIQIRFGRSVRALRKRQAISQEELAERAGLHRTYVCDIERGARNVSLKSIEKLANALGVPVAELFIEDETSSSADDVATVGSLESNGRNAEERQEY